MKQKLLYITHTPWGWIKQRPQFLAEELSEFFEIDVLYRRSNHITSGWNQKKRTEEAKLYSLDGFHNIPFERFRHLPIKTMYHFNKILWNLKHVDLNKYDYIWVTDSLLWWLIKDKIRNAKVIYDCMDDTLEFPYTKKYKNLYHFREETECELVNNANFVFCSSEWLAKTITNRYNVKRRINVVNNAISDSFTGLSKTVSTQHDTPTLTYIGTISEWFDFDLILHALEKYPQIEVRLYGPIRTPYIPSHERLKIMGSISHDKIIDTMNEASGLIMPFVVNDLILSVNPVKLYEYIYSGKPIAAVKYGETEKFAEHVTLYETKEDFYRFIETCILKSYKPNATKMRTFALSNTWSKRGNEIVKIISSR